MITAVKWWYREHLRADWTVLDILHTLEDVAEEYSNVSEGKRQTGWH